MAVHDHRSTLAHLKRRVPHVFGIHGRRAGRSLEQRASPLANHGWSDPSNGLTPAEIQSFICKVWLDATLESLQPLLQMQNVESKATGVVLVAVRIRD